MKGPVAIMGLKRNAHRVLVKSLKERDRLDDISVDVWIILKWILKIRRNGVDWILLAQKTNPFLTLENT